MPGFLMHLIEGEMIINKINTGVTSAADSRLLAIKADPEQFLLGCILPDITDNKERTHFRPAWQKNLITKYPDLDYIRALYPDDAILSPADYGILAHLHLDTHYVTDFWPDYFTIENTAGNTCFDTRQPLYVHISSQPEKKIPLAEFFSDRYFYGEYDRINPRLLKDFHPYIPEQITYQPELVHITECRPEDPSQITKALQTYIIQNPSPAPEASVRFRLFTTDFWGDSSSSAAVTSICFGDRKENSPFFFTSRTFMITSPFPNSFFAASVASASVFPVNFLIIILFLVPVSVQCA